MSPGMAGLRSAQEMRFTSGVVKFLLHHDALAAYREGQPAPICTHVSPTAACSLRCEYCSVAQRGKREEIPLKRIERYLRQLRTRGLKAVILTGGGEPTMYPGINPLLAHLREANLQVGLITNGVTVDRVEDGGAFDWVRVSVNFFDGWQEALALPHGLRDDCTVGLSVIWPERETVGHMGPVSALADRLDAAYIRLLPDCFLEGEEFNSVHREIAQFVASSSDKRFFQQNKQKRAPQCGVCHQAFFRPYLSEVGGGTVFPCDSVVLNTQDHRFLERYALCAAEQVTDWLDGRIKPRFRPHTDCAGCVFADTVEILGFVKGGVQHVDFP